MLDGVKRFWRQVNEPLLNPDRGGPISTQAVRRVWMRAFWKPHWPKILTAILLICLLGATFKFFLAWTTRVIADDIVQVHLLAEDPPPATQVDPSRPDENRTFALDDGKSHQAWTHRHDEVPGKTLRQKYGDLGQLALLLLGVVLAHHLALWRAAHLRLDVGEKAFFSLRNRAYQKLHELPMAYHDTTSLGTIMTHLCSDVRVIQMASMQLLQQVPIHVTTMVLGLWILFSVDASLALLVCLALPAYGFAYAWFHGKQKTVNANLREREGRLDGHITNRIRNFYLVKSFGKEIREGIDFLRRSRAIIRDNMTAAVLANLFAVVCTVFSGVCMAGVLWLGALRVRDGEMTLGNLLLFYSSAGFMFEPIASISQLTNLFHRLSTRCDKFVRLMDEPTTLPEAEKPAPVPADAPELQFQNVTLRYSDDRDPALKNVSFTLPAGKTLCVMGPSGAGKSTLAKIACRIYDPTDGQVLVNGTDLGQFKLAHLRRVAGFVSQEPIIFDGTIRDNIRYGSEQAPWRSMVLAAQYAQIHEFIQRLPEQYETQTRERGLTLSGGQKQRVNLARVLLYDPKILVLDDCTSALDAETEAKLVKGFDDVLAGRTVVLVSHRLSIATRCDYVLMLDAGQAVQCGPPEELMDVEGPFADLCREQIDKGAKVLQLQTS